MADMNTRIFRASLRGRLYRDIELPSGGSLEDLAKAIVGAFGFDLDHAFGFYSSLGHRYHDAEERYELFADLGQADEGVRGVRRTKLSTAFPEPGKQMLFLFDYGDEWRFWGGRRRPSTRGWSSGSASRRRNIRTSRTRKDEGSATPDASLGRTTPSPRLPELHLFVCLRRRGDDPPDQLLELGHGRG
jgi:hypothetical protein